MRECYSLVTPTIIGIFNNLNVICIRYNLAVIYKRVGENQLALANFQYVVNSGKNLPIVARARSSLKASYFNQ